MEKLITYLLKNKNPKWDSYDRQQIDNFICSARVMYGRGQSACAHTVLVGLFAWAEVSMSAWPTGELINILKS